LEAAYDSSGEHWLNVIVNHPAVMKHGQGVSSVELASFIGEISSFAQDRIMGVGYDQYDQGRNHQVFEDLTPPQLIQAALEEFTDGINYLGMIAIKMIAAYKALDCAANA
jgi:hypothetical protein